MWGRHDRTQNVGLSRRAKVKDRDGWGERDSNVTFMNRYDGETEIWTWCHRKHRKLDTKRWGTQIDNKLKPEWIQNMKQYKVNHELFSKTQNTRSNSRMMTASLPETQGEPHRLWIYCDQKFTSIWLTFHFIFSIRGCLHACSFRLLNQYNRIYCSGNFSLTVHDHVYDRV